METIKAGCTGRKGLARKRKSYGKMEVSRRWERREQGSFLKAGRLLFRCHIELDLIPFCSTLLERKQYTPSVDRSVFQPSAFLSLSLSLSLGTRPDFISFTSAASSFFIDPPSGRSPGLALWMKEERERESFHDTVKTYPRRILHGIREMKERVRRGNTLPLFFATVNRIGTFKRLGQ